MRSLYLVSLYNSEQQIQQIKFIDDGVEVFYADNTRKQFTFVTHNPNIQEEISEKLDKVIEVNEKNENSSDKENIKVKYEELSVFSGICFHYYKQFNTSRVRLMLIKYIYFLYKLVPETESMESIQMGTGMKIFNTSRTRPMLIIKIFIL
jgi:hypothetical protein